MGTRADFYVGRGETAEWLGSVAWDGDPEGVLAHWSKDENDLPVACSEHEWREAVETWMRKRDDSTFPADGWPWPWDDSSVTDCSYWWDGGVVYGEAGGHYYAASEEYPDDPTGDRIAFPNMKDRKAVTMGRRSGIMTITPFGVVDPAEQDVREALER